MSSIRRRRNVKKDDIQEKKVRPLGGFLDAHVNAARRHETRGNEDGRPIRGVEPATKRWKWKYYVTTGGHLQKERNREGEENEAGSKGEGENEVNSRGGIERKRMRYVREMKFVRMCGMNVCLTER